MRLRNLSIISLVFIPTPVLATTYVCEACPAGTWGDGTNCNTCSAGTYAYAGSSSCTSCLTTGVASCSATTGKATSCKGGFGFLSSGACSQCSAGNYSYGGTGGCSSCSSGYYSNAGASSCTRCPAGKYSSSAGSSSCTSCAAGTYSTGGASSCTSCPAGKYTSSAGSSSCSSCSSTSYGAWSGTCGAVSRSVTKYCTTAGSTSSTGNSSTTTESTTLYCSGHNSCSATTNGTCTACSKPSNSGWDSDSGCGWHCNGGYYRSGNMCKLRIYAYYKTVRACDGSRENGYFSVTKYDYKKEMVDSASYTHTGSRDDIIFSSTNPPSHTVSRGCTEDDFKATRYLETASTRLTPVNEGSYLNLSEKCTHGSGIINECSWWSRTYTWTRK